MGLWQRLKNAVTKAWRSFTGGGSSSRSSGGGSSRSSSGSSYYSRRDGGSGSGSYDNYRARKEQAEREKKKRKQQQERLNAYKPKEVSYKSMADTVKNSVQKTNSSLSNAVTKATTTDIKQQKVGEARLARLKEQKSFNDSLKKTGADSKEQREFLRAKDDKRNALIEQRKKAYATERANAERRKKERKEYHEATQHRFDVKGATDKAEKLRRRQNVKSQTYDKNTALAEEKHELKYHKKAYSMARQGAMSAPWSLGELAEKKATKGEAKKAADYYEKNKDPLFAALGEVGASLASFGLTSGASKAAVSKLAPKALKQGSEKFAVKLARNKLIRKAAEKEAANAVKKGLVKEGSKELVEKIAKNKAKDVVANLAEDAAVNVTTGGLMDFNKATAEHKIGSKDWWKEMGTSAAMNVGLGTAATVGLPAAGKGVKRALGGVSEEGKRGVAEALEAVGKRAKANVKLNPSVREAVEEGVKKPLSKAVVGNAPKIEVSTARTANSVKNATGIDIRKPMSTADFDTLREFRDRFVKSLNDVEEGSPVEKKLKEDIKNIDRVLKRADRATTVADEAVETVVKQTDEAVDTIAKNADEARIRATRQTPLSETKRVDTRRAEIERELEEAHAVAGDVNQSDEVREAAAKRFDELMEERRNLETENVNADGSVVRNADEVAEAATGTRTTQEIINDDTISFEQKKALYDERMRAIDDELDDIVDKADAGDAAAIRRSEELVEEQIELSRNFDEVEANYKTEQEINRIAENPRNTVNDEIRRAVPEEERARWSPDGEKEGYTVKEAEDIWQGNVRDNEYHTKQGAFTVTTGMGDKKFNGAMKDAIANGEVTIEVYHDKENYAKAVNRIIAYSEGVGGESGRGNIDTLIENFSKYADGKLKINSKEQRDMLYDILAAVDYANGNKNAPWAEDLFVSSTKAGAELSSVSGLSLRQWHKIAMSSPEHRAKAVKAQVEAMFNKSRGFRKVHGKLKTATQRAVDDVSGFAQVDEGLGLDDFIDRNPELTTDLKGALDKLQNANSKGEVEQAASEVLLEARKVMPVTAFDQLTQWRYVAMLSSPTTHIKNIVGNIYSGTLGQMASAIASGTENRLIKSGKVGDDYLKSASGLSMTARNDAKKGVFEGIKVDNIQTKLDKARKALEKADEGSIAAAEKKVADLEAQLAKAQDALGKATPKNVTAAKAQELFHTVDKDKLILDAVKFEQMHAKGVKGGISKGISKASDFISTALETSDAVAVERIYRETADKVLRANDYEGLLKRAAEASGKEKSELLVRVAQLEEYASQHAAYKAAQDTYRNYNAVASWINKTVSNTLYNADAKWYQKAGGFLLNAVMPFTKVPTNILKRSIDYSPVGLIQGKKMLNEALKTGNYAEINKAAERLAEGKIGTGIAALGMGLGMIDPDGMTITGRLDRNSEFDKMKKDRGYTDYSVKVGNRDYTLEWATPTASTLFVGVEVGRMLRNAFDSIAENNGLEFKPSEAFEVCNEILSTLIEPNLQLTMFQGINSIIEDTVSAEQHGQANIHPIINAVGNITNQYISSLSPSVLNRLSRAFAPYDYFISGDNDYEYKKNAALAKVPILSKKMFDAKTNAWGEIKGEAKTPAEKALKAGVTLFSPMNVSKVTWDDTDTELYELSKTLGTDILPKNFYGYYDEDGKFTSEAKLGRNPDNTLNFKMTNNDKAQYNIARGKAGEDAMTVALESIMFNRRTKDAKGKSIPRADAYTTEQKSALINEYKDKSTKDVVNWAFEQPEFKKATPKEQAKLIKDIVGNGSTDASKGAKRKSELTVAQRHGISEDEYNYKNEITEKNQKSLDDLVSAGVLTYAQAVDFNRNAAKMGYYEDDGGGYSKASYSQESIMNYLATADLDDEAKKALYDAYYTGKQSYEQALAKYGKGKRGYRRRGYRRRGYRRYGRGGGGSGVKSTAKVEPNAYKSKKETFKSMAQSLPKANTQTGQQKTFKAKKSATTKSYLKTAKITPPKAKMKKYEV